MGPTAMLIAGVTVANYDLGEMFKMKKVYAATALRLIVIPSVIFAIMFGVKELVNLAFGTSIDNTPIILIFFAIATPLGLNTIVFPEAYGGDPETGAAMAMISHTICVITIPIMFMLTCMLLGTNTWLPVQF
jgi:predicted permease